MSNAELRFETGYKDDKKVVVDADGSWAPTNKELFTLIEMWFEAEDAWFGDGYGSTMPWFYVSLIALGESHAAQAAYQKEGYAAIEHFHECIDEYGDDVINLVTELQDND